MDAIDRLAGPQHGVVARRQLLAHGVAGRAVRTASEAGRLERVAQGLYRVPGSPRTHTQALWMAHLAAGPASVVSHGSAARVWRLQAIEHCEPTVSVPHRLSPDTAGLAIVHRSRHLEPVDVTTRLGLPVTTQARTLVDVARSCGRSRLRSALDSARFDCRVPIAEIGEAALRLSGPGWRGTGLLCELLDERDDSDAMSQSALEDLLGQVLRGAGITRFRRQHPLPSLGGISGFVDVYVDELELIAEGDGRRWHVRQAALRRDHQRDFAAQQLGIVTVRFLHEHLTTDLEGCIAGMRRIADARRSVVSALRADEDR
ncbi:MAG: type IV toxin-antitoxin system AbiEi family antitoxin domain-containing protein, partial [Microthrixaceae bacterium]|nr:type IV toxin-antitoxin system AbiEi family antitoxin domain-containing protein [Microthrixaceae bacterium]